jgi:hypothetical protein
MKKVFFLVFILTFYGCTKIDDDTNSFCNADCTTLQGKFVSANNEGVQGVKVSINYRISGGPLGGGRIRKITETVTDQDGNFYKKFYIKESELGSSEGYFKVLIDDSNLDVDKYILIDNQIGTTTSPLDFTISQINTRDTIIGNTFYLPKKAHIKVNLNNFVPLQSGDIFEVRTFYPFGQNVGYNEFLDSEYDTGFSGWGTFIATELNSQLHPFVAENEQNIIHIIKRKNGISTTEEITLFIPPNNSIELSFDY